MKVKTNVKAGGLHVYVDAEIRFGCGGNKDCDKEREPECA
jgi:hypothetical protein